MCCVCSQTVVIAFLPHAFGQTGGITAVHCFIALHYDFHSHSQSLVVTFVSVIVVVGLRASPVSAIIPA